jgi:hypothetical protein
MNISDNLVHAKRISDGFKPVQASRDVLHGISWGAGNAEIKTSQLSCKFCVKHLLYVASEALTSVTMGI